MKQLSISELVMDLEEQELSFKAMKIDQVRKGEIQQAEEDDIFAIFRDKIVYKRVTDCNLDNMTTCNSFNANWQITVTLEEQFMISFHLLIGFYRF